MSDYAIEVKNYSLSYEEDGAAILQDCSLFVRYGELVLLSGLSGSGKSTLLSSINGLIPGAVSAVQSGDILVDGVSVVGKRIAELARKVGSVLQNADSQIVHARVEDEIAFGCENLNVPASEIHSRVDAACEMMKLDKNQATATLSGGQKQRLITASTLAMRQRILVFDEPLANLDIAGAHMLLRLLKELTAQGYAVLFVEHRLDVVLPYADRVYWMENGAAREVKKEDWEHVSGRGKLPHTDSARAFTEPLLDVEHIAYAVNGKQILRDISFTLHAGERIVILGENGCGKTTLLKILARLLTPTGGEIVQYLDGSLIKISSARWLKQVGFVYQNPNYQLFMPSVSGEIGYGAASAEHAARCMDAFALQTLAERHPQSLSEGQKRRVSIAAIAVAAPKLLLLDEPTVGQDFDNLRRMVETVNRLNRENGMSVITVTHDARCAEALADRTIRIADGVIA